MRVAQGFPSRVFSPDIIVLDGWEFQAGTEGDRRQQNMYFEVSFRSGTFCSISESVGRCRELLRNLHDAQKLETVFSFTMQVSPARIS